MKRFPVVGIFSIGVIAFILFVSCSTEPDLRNMINDHVDYLCPNDSLPDGHESESAQTATSPVLTGERL